MQKSKYGQGLIPNPYHLKMAPIRARSLEQGNNGSHTRTVNQAQAGQIDENLGGLLVTDLGDDRSKLNDRDGIELTLNSKGGRARVCGEMKMHTLCHDQGGGF
jgi:hypothetical protein